MKKMIVQSKLVSTVELCVNFIWLKTSRGAETFFSWQDQNVIIDDHQGYMSALLLKQVKSKKIGDHIIEN